MERLFPDFATMRPEEIYAGLAFPPAGPLRPYTVINMVTTVDGKATNLAGKAANLGSSVDRIVMRRIRAAADGVLNGAETLRRENVNPSVPPELEAARLAAGMKPQPVAVTVTASGNLPLERTFFQSSSFEKVVVLTDRTPADRVAALAGRARVVRAGRDRVDLALMMRLLREEAGIRTLVVEGGPMLNAELISLGMVDELFWTVAPKILAGPAERTMVEERPIPAEERPGLELVSIHHEASELYMRYRFGRPGE